MSTFIGIDPATLCGWAVLDNKGKRIASGTWNLSRRRHDGAGMVFVRFEQLFRELLEAYPNAVVAFEQQANRYAGAAHIGLGIISHIERICEESQTPYAGVAFSTIKKFATGKGNASKQMMERAAVEKWGGVGDDNEADALFVAACAQGGLA